MPQQFNSGFDREDVDDMVRDRHGSYTIECELRTVSDVVAEHELERIDLLKINVEKAEADVLAGIDENDWPKIWQLTMQIHDIEDRVRAVRADLERLGYEVAVDQDPLLVGTDIFDLYAKRRKERGA